MSAITLFDLSLHAHSHGGVNNNGYISGRTHTHNYTHMHTPEQSSTQTNKQTQTHKQTKRQAWKANNFFFFINNKKKIRRRQIRRKEKAGNKNWFLKTKSVTGCVATWRVTSSQHSPLSFCCQHQVCKVKTRGPQKINKKLVSTNKKNKWWCISVLVGKLWRCDYKL